MLFRRGRRVQQTAAATTALLSAGTILSAGTMMRDSGRVL
jgi:hypothetical protein